MRISDWSSDVCSSDLTSLFPSIHLRPKRRSLRTVRNSKAEGGRLSAYLSSIDNRRQRLARKVIENAEARDRRPRTARRPGSRAIGAGAAPTAVPLLRDRRHLTRARSEAHTSELQSL